MVKDNGNNGLTRANLLTALKNIDHFNAGGMVATTNVGNKVTVGLLRARRSCKSGKFVRVCPTKKGTFDCNKSNHVQVKADLIK